MKSLMLTHFAEGTHSKPGEHAWGKGHTDAQTSTRFLLVEGLLGLYHVGSLAVISVLRASERSCRAVTFMEMLNLSVEG